MILSGSTMLYVEAVVSNWLTIHIRIWAADNGASTGRATRERAGRAAPRSSICLASDATSGWSNKVFTDSLLPVTEFTRDTTRIADSELPWRSKKLSSAPTEASSTPRISANMPVRRRSRSVSGAR